MAKFTFVVEFDDGMEPAISGSTKILGGNLVFCAFKDLTLGFNEAEDALQGCSLEIPDLPILGSNSEWYQGYAAGAKDMRNSFLSSLRAAGLREVGR